jgi:hypothetical protein
MRASRLSFGLFRRVIGSPTTRRAQGDEKVSSLGRRRSLRRLEQTSLSIPCPQAKAAIGRDAPIEFGSSYSFPVLPPLWPRSWLRRTRKWRTGPAVGEGPSKKTRLGRRTGSASESGARVGAHESKKRADPFAAAGIEEPRQRRRTWPAESQKVEGEPRLGGLLYSLA